MTALALKYGFVPAQVDAMLYWITEREAIRKAKDAGAPKPWTLDPIMQSWRFTNVRRADDLVSRQLYTQFYQDDSPTTQLVAATLGRLINWPETLMEVTSGEHFRLEHLENAGDILHARSKRGEKIHSAAYIIPGVPGFTKIDSVLLTVERVRQSAETIFSSTKRETWSNLMEIEFLGSFLAGQIVCDLGDLQSGRGWPDRATFAPVGPGSARGMNYLKGRPRNLAVTQDQFDRELPQLIAVLAPEIPDIVKDRQLTASDFQNCTCEYSKIASAKEGGRFKSRYDGAQVRQAALF